MAGHVQHRKIDPQNGYGIALCHHVIIGAGGAVRRTPDLAARLCLQGSNGTCVVKMMVSDQNARELNVFSLQRRQHRSRLTRIHNESLIVAHNQPDVVVAEGPNRRYSQHIH